MRTPIIYWAIVFLTNHIIIAQPFLGFTTGITLNHSKQEKVNSFKVKTQSGLLFGTQIQLALKKKISLNSGVYFAQKNYSIQNSSIPTKSAIKFINSYLQIPLGFQINLISKKDISLKCESGTYISYWMLSRSKGRAPNIFDTRPAVDADGNIIENVTIAFYNKRNDFSKKLDKRIEAGLLLGSSLILYQDPCIFFVKLLLSQGLTSQEKDHSINVNHKFNQTLSIEFGVLRKIRLNP